MLLTNLIILIQYLLSYLSQEVNFESYSILLIYGSPESKIG